MLYSTWILVKPVDMNVFHVNNRRGTLCLSQGRRMSYPAWRQYLVNFMGLVGIVNTTIGKTEPIFAGLGHGKLSWFSTLHIHSSLLQVMAWAPRFSESWHSATWTQETNLTEISINSGIILWMCSANERWRYNVYLLIMSGAKALAAMVLN